MNIEKSEYSLAKIYTNPKEAVEQKNLIYWQSVKFLRKAFLKAPKTKQGGKRYRGFYPEIGIQIDRLFKLILD